MFIKTALTFLAVGALSVNALTAPVARSPSPDPECKFPRSFPIPSYHALTSVSRSTAQELEAWMLKRDLSYDLFSREPEEWVQWTKRGKDRTYTDSKGNVVGGDGKPKLPTRG